MDATDFEGSLVLEKLAAVSKVEEFFPSGGPFGEFFEAVDSDDVARVAAIMKKANVDAPTIAIVIRKMAVADGEH